jgi:hypothetical protein
MHKHTHTHTHTYTDLKVLEPIHRTFDLEVKPVHRNLKVLKPYRESLNVLEPIHRTYDLQVKPDDL